ncbi:hypothetical protein J5N97_003202 [Dioscorea zingiberensis]|uniref:Uncharacterized protein n=1 Tax=Dioscorea zingiberensis TaxID=325984 RepID=A0A9D5D3S5_9LILI|nr:hypothetical protein J5N97_003202 [Dioscorea zingiberensis]
MTTATIDDDRKSLATETAPKGEEGLGYSISLVADPSLSPSAKPSETESSPSNTAQLLCIYGGNKKTVSCSDEVHLDGSSNRDLAIIEASAATISFWRRRRRQTCLAVAAQHQRQLR